MKNNTKLVLGIATATLTMAGVLVSPQAAAGSKAQHHAEVAGVSSKVDALEAQLQAMQAEISRLRAEANRPRTSADSAKVQELDQWMNSVKSKPVKEYAKDHQVSVRGGWMHFNDNRVGTQTLEGVNPAFGSDRDAHYYGGVFDFNVNNDLFGMMDHTSFAIELGVEYAQLAESKDNGLGGTGLVGRPAAQADVNQLRLSASPKIKFMHGSKLRPWLIPAGLDINIISPPSNAITVMNTGMQFGTGVDYELFRGIVIGADGRYHHSFDDVDGVDTDGFTLGGSVGFKF
jgi:opacity protein-like surface antigen